MGSYDDIPLIRSSSLKNYLDESPLKARYNELDNEDKPHFLFGRLFHQMMEHQSTELSTVAISDFARHAGKEFNIWKAEQIEAGLDIIKRKDYEVICDAYEAVASQVPEELSDILGSPSTNREVVYTFNKYKAQVDIDAGLLMVDWKTIADLNNVSRDATKHGHFLQAYHYSMCKYQSFNPSDFGRFIYAYVEKKAPYECLFYEVDTTAMLFGQWQWEKAQQMYDLCNKNERWPNRHDNKIANFTIPEYLMPEFELEDF